MNRILLIVCAVLMLTASAHARSSKVGLPDHMLGGWCGAPELDYGKGDAWKPCKFDPSECPGECIKVEPRKFTSNVAGYHCLFNKVEHVGSQTWWVYARCFEEHGSRDRVFTFQGQASHDNKWIGLHINDMTEYSK